MNDYSDAAKQAAQTICAVLEDMRLAAPSAFFLDATSKNVWLVAALNPSALGGKINAYTNQHTLYQLSTALGGKPVILSNHTGLRYGVLLSPLPRLPSQVSYPDDVQAVGAMPLGVTLGRKFHPPANKLMNILVGGEQGSGKSQLQQSLAYSAIQNGWQVYAADPRALTFDETWNGVLAAPVAEKADGVLEIMARLDVEMGRRAELFRATRTVNGLPAASIDSYNIIIGTGEKMPRVFFLIDEANTFLDDERVKTRLNDLSRQPRKFGIHFILAAHDWRAETVKRGISANFHTRICLRVADDTSGAAVLNSVVWGKTMMKVKQPGRAVIFLDGHYTRLQLYQIDDERIIALLSAGKPAPMLTDDERTIAMRALHETEGKISRDVLSGFGLGRSEADRLMEKWTARGWAEKDPQRSNATYITPLLSDLARSPATPATGRSLPAAPATAPATPTTAEQVFTSRGSLQGA